MAPSDREAFLTTEEVLDYLQVNLRTVYRLIEAGKLPAVRVGRQWRFRRSDIDAWLNRQPADTSPDATPPRPASGQARRVLVVDPTATTRDATAAALRAAGHTVDTAPDGVVAVERLGATDYALLVTELQLPSLDVVAVFREARRRRPGLKLMVVTAHSNEARAIEALNAGVSGYLRQPAGAAAIAALAARLLA